MPREHLSILGRSRPVLPDIEARLESSNPGVKRMKHLLSGVAVAALAVTFAPGWTQVSAANQLAAAAISDASTTSAMPPKHRSARIHHHSAGGGKMGSRSGGNTMADQLNGRNSRDCSQAGQCRPLNPPRSRHGGPSCKVRGRPAADDHGGPRGEPLRLPFEMHGERRDLTGAILIVRPCPTEDREEGSQI